MTSAYSGKSCRCVLGGTRLHTVLYAPFVPSRLLRKSSPLSALFTENVLRLRASLALVVYAFVHSLRSRLPAVAIRTILRPQLSESLAASKSCDCIFGGVKYFLCRIKAGVILSPTVIDVLTKNLKNKFR